ncbi:MAG: Type 1 glutamine amidotransferase-like domain-containing protein [Pseudomonadales bacterium]|nr:Type 1 glutamine amidotransferase-like domain-containing protein [Pseudomonadales bacterium]
MGPLLLLADSQLFFTQQKGNWMRRKISEHLQYWQSSSNNREAVYMGAANNNDPMYYDLANSALRALGASRCTFLKSGTSDLPGKNHKLPAVVLLAGGDVQLGWQTISQPDIRDWLTGCWQQGSLIIGVSAGAIHLTYMINTSETGQLELRDFLKWYPVVTMVHEEQALWPSHIKYQEYCAQRSIAAELACLKIPFGSGVWITQQQNSQNQDSQIVTFGRHQSELLQDGVKLDLPYYP